MLSVVNAGPPETEYLYYPLDLEGVTLKGLLLQAHIKQTIIICYQNSFYMPVSILLLTK